MAFQFDTVLLNNIRENWDALKLDLISEVDAHYDVFEDGSFRIQKFSNYLMRKGIEWVRSERGQLLLDKSTFKSRALVHPELWPKVGDGLKGSRRRIVGIFEPPLLHRRSDTPCPTIASSS
jgi:hypothetical protein